MIWVYAVCGRAELRLPPVRGLAEALLEEIAEGQLLAVASRHDRMPAEPGLDGLWAHEGVVEALMEERAVLPMRFGTRLPDAAAVRAALAERREPLLAALDHVRGRVELAVRAVRPADTAAASTPASGRDYLRARLRAGRSSASLHEPLAALAVGSLRRPVLAPGEVLRASYLVEQSAVARFRGAVERLQQEHPEADLVCTGPWPAYSFVDGASG